MTDSKEVEGMSQLAQGESETAPTTIEGPGRAVAVRREAVPKELEALGVKVAVDPTSDMQILIIPKGLREKANVLTPVQAFQQADPNWRPSLRVVELDPTPEGTHFYKQQGRLAPRKQALELLADAAGVVQVHTQLLGRERVEVGEVMAETFTHLAVLKIRKSDGTLRTLEASRTYEPFAEYEELKANAKGPADLRKKWLNEIKFAKAKNESKAVNRAMRAALQIPHTYTAQDAAKPFVVVGWNLAPQDTVAVQAAIAQLYGAAPEALDVAPPVVNDWDLPELAEGELVEEDADLASGQQAAAEAETPLSDSSAAVPDPHDSPEGDVAPAEQEREPAGDDPGEQTPEGEGDPNPADDPPASPSDEPDIPDVDGLTEREQEALPRALQIAVPNGSFQGKTIGFVLERGEGADEWLAYALRQPWPQDQTFLKALVLALRAYRPDIVAAWRAEA